MLLATLKHEGKWNLLAHVFDTKAPTFERMITTLLQIVSNHAYDCYVTRMLAKFSMKRFLESDAAFSHIPYAQYATDVTF